MQTKLIVGLKEFATCLAHKWLGYSTPRISFVTAVSSRTNAGSRHVTTKSFRSSIKFISYSGVLGRRYFFYNKIKFNFPFAMLYMFLWNEKIHISKMLFILASLAIQVDLLDGFWSVANKSNDEDGGSIQDR